jgi:hypothetical protein
MSTHKKKNIVIGVIVFLYLVLMLICLYKISKLGSEKKELEKGIRILELEKKAKNSEIEKLKKSEEGLSKEELELIEEKKYMEMATVMRINNLDNVDIEKIDKSILALENNIKTYKRQKKNYPKLAKISNLHINICQETIKRYQELKELKNSKKNNLD